MSRRFFISLNMNFSRYTQSYFPRPVAIWARNAPGGCASMVSIHSAWYGLSSIIFLKKNVELWNSVELVFHTWKPCATTDTGQPWNRGTNFSKISTKMCVYKLLEQTYTHAHSYICCIFCSTVPHPSKNDVVALVPQRLQPVEHWFHTCSSSSTL